MNVNPDNHTGVCKITGCGQKSNGRGLCDDHQRAYWKARTRKHRAPSGLGDDFLDGWDCEPRTSARPLEERQQGVVYGAWHECAERVWERGLRLLCDGECFETYWHVVKRVGAASYDVYDRLGQRQARIVSTSNPKALAAVMEKLIALEGVAA